MNENFTDFVVLEYHPDLALFLAKFIKLKIEQTTGQTRWLLQAIQTELETKARLAFLCHNTRQDKLMEIIQAYTKLEDRVAKVKV